MVTTGSGTGGQKNRRATIGAALRRFASVLARRRNSLQSSSRRATIRAALRRFASVLAAQASRMRRAWVSSVIR